MEKTFILKNLDCANCASKIETAVNKIKGVLDVSVNFFTTKMIVEFEKEVTAELIEEIRKVVKKKESSVIVEEI